ncbi:MAG: hypothetical protein MPN21_26485, partial [Thermoanaerobaculia bacterium]|nr:hypothetical protein [Thermoanaerobaculia bacterium]
LASGSCLGVLRASALAAILLLAASQPAAPMRAVRVEEAGSLGAFLAQADTLSRSFADADVKEPCRSGKQRAAAEEGTEKETFEHESPFVEVE